jgi:hypothetical protein
LSCAQSCGGAGQSSGNGAFFYPWRIRRLYRWIHQRLSNPAIYFPKYAFLPRTSPSSFTSGIFQYGVVIGVQYPLLIFNPDFLRVELQQVPGDGYCF